ncbi:MAG: hypothetical protein PUP92_28275 [Rhizonema sp. PD38]|nr:hypothetical protein [Rhizonema sp. PD38]
MSLLLIVLTTPIAVLAHGGHGDEFQETTQATTVSIQVDRFGYRN